MNKTNTLWDVAADLQFTVSNFEKIKWLAESLMDATALAPSEQANAEKGYLLSRINESNVIASILLDELHTMSGTLTNVSATAESLYEASVKAKAETNDSGTDVYIVKPA